jgi:hypothetical protein
MPTRSRETVRNDNVNFSDVPNNELYNLIAMKLISKLFECGAITKKEYCEAIKEKK